MSSLFFSHSLHFAPLLPVPPSSLSFPSFLSASLVHGMVLMYSPDGTRGGEFEGIGSVQGIERSAL